MAILMIRLPPPQVLTGSEGNELHAKNKCQGEAAAVARYCDGGAPAARIPNAACASAAARRPPHCCIHGPAAALRIRLHAKEPTRDPRTTEMNAVPSIGPKRYASLRMSAPRMALSGAHTPPEDSHSRRNHQKADRGLLHNECVTVRQRVKPPKADAL